VNPLEAPTPAPQHPTGDPRRKVHARVALALLETLQRMDLPEEVLKDENLSVTLPRRLGLSHVVDAQVRRYREEARRNRKVPEPEVMDLMRLVARRPDASDVFLEVGRELSRELSRGWRGLVPARMALRMAGKRGARLLRDLMGGPVVRLPAGSHALVLVHPGLAQVALGGAACSLVTGVLEGAARVTGRVPIRVRMVAGSVAGSDPWTWILEEHRPELVAEGDGSAEGVDTDPVAPEEGGPEETNATPGPGEALSA
jgi:hypothetical protein